MHRCETSKGMNMVTTKLAKKKLLNWVRPEVSLNNSLCVVRCISEWYIFVYVIYTVLSNVRSLDRLDVRAWHANLFKQPFSDAHTCHLAICSPQECLIAKPESPCVSWLLGFSKWPDVVANGVIVVAWGWATFFGTEESEKSWLFTIGTL